MRHRNRTLCDGTDAVAMVSLYEDADDRCHLKALANKKHGYYTTDNYSYELGCGQSQLHNLTLMCCK